MQGRQAGWRTCGEKRLCPGSQDCAERTKPLPMNDTMKVPIVICGGIGGCGGGGVRGWCGVVCGVSARVGWCACVWGEPEGGRVEIS